MASYGHESLGRTWIWMAVLAVISILGGLFALFDPFAATMAAVFIAGWFFTLQGVIQIFHAFSVRDWSGFIWTLGLGVLGLLLGIMLIADPLAGAVSLTLVVAVLFLLAGALKVMFAFAAMPVGGWGWVLASGIVSLLLGIMILADFPASASAILGLLLGIELLSNGILFLFMALGLKRHNASGGM
jgi:membrane protein HdeD